MLKKISTYTRCRASAYCFVQHHYENLADTGYCLPDEDDTSIDDSSEFGLDFCYDHTVLDEGVKVLVRKDYDESYTGTVLAYDAGKHLIRYDVDEEEELVDLATEGYILFEESDDLVEDEECKEGDEEDDDSDYSIEEAELVAPSTQKKKKTTQKKKQPPTQKQKQTIPQPPKGVRRRNRKVGAFDGPVMSQNVIIARCNFNSKFHQGDDKCICVTCKTNAADYSNSFILQSTTGGEEDKSVGIYIPIVPSLSDALEYDPEFGEKYNKLAAIMKEEKGVMLQFGVKWVSSFKGQTVIPRKYEDAAEKIPIIVNGIKHMLHAEYKEYKKKAWEEYSVARKKLLKRLVTEGCKAGRETRELLKLIDGLDIKSAKHGKDFNIEDRHFQSPYTNEMAADYIELSKKGHASLSVKEQYQKNSLGSDLQYSIAFDALVMLMKAAVNPGTRAGQILLGYWKHEIIEKYFRQLATKKCTQKKWERLEYSHMVTDEWVKGVLQLNFVKPTEYDREVEN